jgi:putative hydrolase of the HAD superfamily
MSEQRISTLFLDIGGVLLTNGWDRTARQNAARQFNLDLDDMEERHHLTYDTYEAGKLSLDEYLKRLVFYQPRAFTRGAFTDFMFACSQAFPEMIQLIQAVKTHYLLRTVAVSNEGRELNAYRIRTFQLEQTIDIFISSCFVHYRKPDPDIFRIALDVSQARPEAVAYIDDRPLFIEVARSLGIHGIRHIDTATTRSELAKLGLAE